MKKKIIVILSVVIFLALVVSGIVFLPKIFDKAQTTSAPESSTSEKVQTTSVPELPTTEKEIKTEVVIENDRHSFTVMKTDFEKNFTEEELWEISSVLSMSFGCDDYYNWNGEAEFVVNELLNNCLTSTKWVFKSLVTEDEDIINKASQELAIYMNDENAQVDYGIVELDVLNSYIKDMYGEKARTFVGEDFMSVEEALKNNGKVFDYHSDMYSQIRYFPQNNLIWLASRDTGYSSAISYIYDITEENGDFIVYAVGGVDNYAADNTFSAHQSYVLKELTWGESSYIYENVCTLGVSENGDFYLKKVEPRCIFADGFSGDYIVNADADLYERKIYTQGLKKVGTIKKGTVVTLGENYIEDEYEYIINEDFSGYIEPEYLEKIG